MLPINRFFILMYLRFSNALSLPLVAPVTLTWFLARVRLPTPLQLCLRHVSSTQPFAGHEGGAKALWRLAEIWAFAASLCCLYQFQVAQRLFTLNPRSAWIPHGWQVRLPSLFQLSRSRNRRRRR